MLTIHRAERADALIEPLTELLLEPPADPFAPDVIAVPSKGVERWVMQQLSLRLGAARGWDGVAANITFPSPTLLFDDVMSSLRGHAAGTDPWTGNQLVWAVLAVMDDCVTEPWCAMLAHHLGHDDADASHRHGRRFSTALQLARLFSSYTEARPSMIIDWSRGDDSDGFGIDLRDDMAWQAAFWRRLRGRIGAPSSAESLAASCTTLREQPHLIGLPARLSVFGPTRMPRNQLAILEALAAGRDVHLWLTHPSPLMWEALRSMQPALRRADDQSSARIGNPLLANLSRDVRELQQLLGVDSVDRHHPPTGLGSSVLARIQDDIRYGRDPSRSTTPLQSDESIAIHACHGHLRQVEVLREALLHRFNDDPTLQARDVIVLCPDVDAFAPLMAAAFGPTNAPHPGHRLRVRMADRGPAHTNPLLQVLQTLLALADGRVTAGEVLDMMASGPVARRFGFSEPELETLRRWVADGGARWGIGETQRERFGLSNIRQNTFSTARDRLLLGISADESELAWLGTALPLDGVDSSDVDLAGRFTEFLDRFEATLVGLRGPHTAQTWSERLETALGLLTEVGPSDGWQQNQAGRFLAELIESASNAQLTLPDLRSVLVEQFRARPTRSNFRTGEITVATLVPMRFVPHRVVAVIGLDDDAFPRVAHVDGDDIMAVNPCLGERDPRSEDRQLLLDALMSAVDHLLLFYTGADPVTGAHRPPPAPLADIIDTLEATVEEGAPVVIRQPLQPFDAVNFTVPHPFSFDRQARAAAAVARSGPQPAPAFIPTALAAVPEREVSIDELVDFLEDPTMGLLRQRLGISFPWDLEDLPESLPLNLAGLPRWHIGERLLSEVLNGATIAAARQAELRRGTLPPGRLGISELDDITTVVTAISGAVIAERQGAEPNSVSIVLDVGNYRLTGSIYDLYGTKLISASYSTLAPKHRIAGWVRLLALRAHGLDAHAKVIGKWNRRAKMVELSPPSDPAAILLELLDIRATGLRGLLPLGPKSSCVYAERLRSASPGDALEMAVKEWTSTSSGPYRNRGENDDKSIRFVYGSDAPFSVWWDQPAPERERWFSDAPVNRFAQLAVRVFGPMVDHEQIMLR